MQNQYNIYLSAISREISVQAEAMTDDTKDQLIQYALERLLAAELSAYRAIIRKDNERFDRIEAHQLVTNRAHEISKNRPRIRKQGNPMKKARELLALMSQEQRDELAKEFFFHNEG